jgi:ComEC/Rec2-related protein
LNVIKNISNNPKKSPELSPCLLPVLGLIAGIAIAEFLPPMFGLTLTIAVISTIGFFYWQNRPLASTLLLLLLAVTTGAIHFYKTNHQLPPNHIRNYLQIPGLEVLSHVELFGTIVSPSSINQPKRTFPYQSSPNFRTRFLLQAHRLKAVGKTVPITGLVEISLPGMHDSYKPGMNVHLTGKLSSIKTRQSKLPCLKTFTYYTHNQIFARMSLGSADSIVTESIDAYSRPAIFHRIQEWSRGLLLGNESPTGPYTDDLLSAVILGKQNFVENEFNRAMTRIGATHFLAVSGFNLAVLAMGIWFIGELLGLKRNTTIYLIIGCVAFYGIVTDFRPSVTRALIMILTVCVGWLKNRRSDTLNALALSAGIILLINPNQLFQPGFQLSFIATLGLIRFSNPIYSALGAFTLFNRNSSERRIGTGWEIATTLEAQTKQLFAASLAASLAATPLVMYHFNLLSLIGPVSSVLLYPAATLLTLAGFAQLVIAMAVPILTPIISVVTDYTATMLSTLAILLGKIPGSALTVASPPWFLVLAFLIVIFTPKLKYQFIGALLIITLYLSSWMINSRSTSPWLYVSGPGQGQSVVINTGKGLAMIDFGASQTGQATKLISQIVYTYLAKPAFVMLTSPDQRYYNDLWQLIDAFPNTTVMIPELVKRFSPGYEPAARLMDDPVFHRLAVREGTAVEMEGVSLTMIYMPKFDGSPGQPDAMTPSAAVLVEHQGSKVLVAPVLTPMSCRLIIRNYPQLRVKTLIVPGWATAGEAMEALIFHADIKEIVLGGWFDRTSRQRWELISRRTGCHVVEIVEDGGFIIDRSEI